MLAAIDAEFREGGDSLPKIQCTQLSGSGYCIMKNGAFTNDK